MNVLVACERSGIVRDAFRELGHEAWSCDIADTYLDSEYHLQCDVKKVLKFGFWDMMIAFPPCTHLARSGAKWFSPKSEWFRPEKIELQRKALVFVRTLMNAPISKIAIENPCGVISTQIRKPDQIVSPWWFGDRIQKLTCLWLKDLPLLKPTKIVEITDEDWIVYPSGKRLPKWYANLDKRHRSVTRGITWKGMSKAMAQQWGGDIR